MNSDSPNTADLVELAARCEQAPGPSDELQFAIAEAAGTIKEIAPFQAGGMGVKSCPAYTHSLDAAMTLVPDGWTSINQEQQKLPDGSMRCWASIDAWPASPKRCATPALALCAAALRARAALKDHRKAQAHD